jgi:hypothetical protein
VQTRHGPVLGSVYISGSGLRVTRPRSSLPRCVTLLPKKRPGYGRRQFLVGAPFWHPDEPQRDAHSSRPSLERSARRRAFQPPSWAHRVRDTGSICPNELRGSGDALRRALSPQVPRAICMRQKARRRSRLGLRVRCLGDAILHHEQLRGYALHLLTNFRIRMTPTFGSTLDGTSGHGMKRVPGVEGTLAVYRDISFERRLAGSSTSK